MGAISERGSISFIARTSRWRGIFGRGFAVRPAQYLEHSQIGRHRVTFGGTSAKAEDFFAIFVEDGYGARLGTGWIFSFGSDGFSQALTWVEISTCTHLSTPWSPRFSAYITHCFLIIALWRLFLFITLVTKRVNDVYVKVLDAI